jgi:predicted PurR-regulated permease PerM
MNASTGEQGMQARALLQRAVEIAVRLSLVGILVVWCFAIFRPFIIPIMWAIVIAVATYPIYAKLLRMVGGRNKIAGTLFVLLLLALLFLPTVRFAGSIVDNANDISDRLESGQLRVPPPSERVRGWPFVGEPLYRTWSEAAANLQSTLQRYGPQVRQLARRLLGTLAGIGRDVLMTAIAIVIAGFMLATAEQGDRTARALFVRLGGTRGSEIVDLIRATIRSVAQGVLGVAVIQAVASAAGLVFAGVPGAGIWTLIVLLLAVMQLPPLLVLGPIAIYVFSANDSTAVSVVFAIWSLLVSISDSFLKPLLLGRGVSVPMPVILIGAIGGMIAYGIIGLFVGATVLAIAHTLFKGWMAAGADPEAVLSGEVSRPEMAPGA